MQSPINIDTDHVQDNYFFSDFSTTYMTMETYENSHTGTWSHTGYTIEWKRTDSRSAPTISGGILQALNFPENPKYYLDSFHLTWGAENCRGSEHTIDGKQASGEIQFVHRGSSYATVSDAKEQYNGILIISILLEVSYGNNTDLEVTLMDF